MHPGEEQVTVAPELDLLVELFASSVSEQALTFFGGKLTPVDRRTGIPEPWGSSGILGMSGDVLVVTVGSGAGWHLVSRGQGCPILRCLGLQQSLYNPESQQREAVQGRQGRGRARPSELTRAFWQPSGD